jgi:hypothetical protein
MYGLNVGKASCQLAFKSLQVLGLARFARHRHPAATNAKSGHSASVIRGTKQNHNTLKTFFQPIRFVVD